LLVREVPRLRRTAVADAVEAAELPLDLRGRLPEPHASECAAGYEDPVLRKCGCERDGCEREHMLGSMASFERIAGLQLEVDGYDLERRDVAVSSEFTRVTTTVVLHGRGERGEGEDVTYTPGDHDGFPTDLPLAGSWTLAEYSARLDAHDLFAREPEHVPYRDYRRWAFESAALDLALRQAGRT